MNEDLEGTRISLWEEDRNQIKGNKVAAGSERTLIPELNDGVRHAFQYDD